MGIKERTGRGRGADDQQQTSSDDKRRERFARAIARSEFGRFYWDERREAELRATRHGRKKPPQKP